MPELVFTTNRTAAPVRRESWDGGDGIAREWLVAPVVGLVPGVLKGELVTSEVVKPSERAWDGVPLVIEHPKRGGQFISAQEADVPHVGLFRKAHVNGKLQGEMWFDVAALVSTGSTGEQVISALEAGEMLEVSTGYFRSVEARAGVHNGQAYQSVAHDIQPDHLAVLLSVPGACSIRDGCGVPRVNEGGIHPNQAGQSGVIVALFLPEADARALAVRASDLPAGSTPVPPEELHVTLAYLGEVEYLEGEGKDQGRALDAVMQFAKNNTLVRGKLNGVARFLQPQEDGSQAVVLLLDSPMLESWKLQLYEVLYGYCDMHPARNHGFTPHITLAYIPADAPMPDILPEQRELVFEKIALSWGGQVTAFDLQGVAMDVQTNEAEQAKRGNELASQKLTVKSALRAIAGAFGINLKEADMEKLVSDKKELIQQLVANERCPLEQSALEKLSPEELQTLAGAFAAPAQDKTVVATVAANGAGFGFDKLNPADTAKTTPTQPAGNELTALTAAVTALTGKVDQIVTNQQAAADAEKTRLVAELVANDAPLPKAALEKLDIGELQTLAQSLIPADYSLQTLAKQGGEWQTWDEYVAKQTVSAGSTQATADGGK